MRFRIEVLKSTFRIVFKRERKDVTFIERTRDGFQSISEKSKFPNTTVTIYRDKDDALPGEVFRTATVGCHHRESYSPEQGRLAALRLVSKTLDKEFKQLLWETYLGDKAIQRAISKAQKEKPPVPVAKI